ncbi:MAG: hypothetical protein IKO80_10030 [Lachnospiraceae bacterium]|nr:hypothetical protein [Lachnospiraceae bacterium]
MRKLTGRRLIAWVTTAAMIAGALTPNLTSHAAESERVVQSADPGRIVTDDNGSIIGSDSEEILRGEIPEVEEIPEAEELPEIEELPETEDLPEAEVFPETDELPSAEETSAPELSTARDANEPERLYAPADLFEFSDNEGHLLDYCEDTNDLKNCESVLKDSYKIGEFPDVQVFSFMIRNVSQNTLYFPKIIAVTEAMTGGSTSNDTILDEELSAGQSKEISIILRSGIKKIGSGFYSKRNHITVYYKTDPDQQGMSSVYVPFDLAVGLMGNYELSDLEDENIQNADTWYLTGDTTISLDAGESIEDTDRLICNSIGTDAALTLSGSGSMTFGNAQLSTINIEGGIVRGNILNTKKPCELNITGGEYRLDSGCRRSQLPRIKLAQSM